MRSYFFMDNRNGGKMPFNFLCSACLFLFFVKGEGLVPEQANEVEESKRGPARSCSSRKRTGECEKRNTSPFRALGNWRGHPPANRGLSSQRRQPRQWPQLRACTLMIHTERTGCILRKETWWQALLKHRLHRELTMAAIFNVIKFRHLESVSHDLQRVLR